jgi:hypothetical protein
VIGRQGAARTGSGRIAALVLAAALFAGCLDVPVASVPPSAAPTPEPTPVTTTYQLGATVWYEGLVIRVDSVRATLDERGGPVEVLLRIDNPGEDDADLSSRILFQVDAASTDAPLAPTRDSKLPTVPAHNLAGAVLTYELQEIPSVESGVVLIGEPPLHVGRVPLTPSGGEALTFEPRETRLSGSGAAGDLKITLRTGLLRSDLPDWSEELPAEVQALTLFYDVTYTGSFTGGYAFTGDNVRLRLPNGKMVAPRRDGHSQSIELVAAGKTKPNLFSRFEIPDGTKGRLALVVLNGSATKAITFNLGG